LLLSRLYVSLTRRRGGAMTQHPEPYDPRCGTYARDMDYLDTFLEGDMTRIMYVLQEEGTYNPENGHFLCDTCYIAAGMPSAPGGWVCP
jgi:hypothetical protein